MGKNKKNEISTPDELNDYINIIKPSAFIVSFAIIILFIGAIVWSIFGHIEDTVESITIVKDFDCKTYVLDKDMAKIKPGMILKINNKKYSVIYISEDKDDMKEILGNSNVEIGNFTIKDKVNEVKIKDMSNAGLTNGIYKGEIVTGNISPIYFLIN